MLHITLLLETHQGRPYWNVECGIIERNDLPIDFPDVKERIHFGAFD